MTQHDLKAEIASRFDAGPAGRMSVSLQSFSYKRGVPKGYFGAEMSWVEEDNVMMTNTAIKLGGKPYRKYRVYERQL